MNPAKIAKMDEEVQKWSKKDPVAIRKAMICPGKFPSQFWWGELCSSEMLLAFMLLFLICSCLCILINYRIQVNEHFVALLTI
jgi:hypothetical protein